MNDWDEAAVAAWIASLGPEFKKHSAAFKSNDINGRRLLKLTDEKLEKLGISSLGVRSASSSSSCLLLLLFMLLLLLLLLGIGSPSFCFRPFSFFHF